MKSAIQFALLSTLFLSLSACSYLRSLEDTVPGYKITVIQGNELSEEQLNQLRTGMTKQEVSALLGKPQLNNPFRKDTWHYVYTVVRGGKFLEKKSVTLVFSGDALTNILSNPERALTN
ncbi:MAG: outer membrane protein assembly factor BamE [Neisseriaceae bacterium]